METPVAKPDSITFDDAVKVAKRIILEVEHFYRSSPYADPYVFMYQQIQDPDGLVPEGAREMWWLYNLIYKAGKSKEAHDSLRKLAGHILHTRQPLPDSLRHWLAEYLAGNRPRPTRPRGDPSQKSTRDTGWRYAVWFLEQRGMTATRNDERDQDRNPEHDTACDAVAKAESKSYHTVKKIWDKRKEADIDAPSLMPNIRVPSLPNPFPTR